MAARTTDSRPWFPSPCIGSQPLTAGAAATIVQARAAAAGSGRSILGGLSLKRGALAAGTDQGEHRARLRRCAAHKSFDVPGGYLEFGDLFEATRSGACCDGFRVGRPDQQAVWVPRHRKHGRTTGGSRSRGEWFPAGWEKPTRAETLPAKRPRWVCGSARPVPPPAMVQERSSRSVAVSCVNCSHNLRPAAGAAKKSLHSPMAHDQIMRARRRSRRAIAAPPRPH